MNELLGIHETTGVIIAVITMGGVVFTSVVACLTALFQWKAKQSLSEVNDAVNHRHEKHGASSLKLYDLVWENHERTNELIEWKRSYDDGPLDDGNKVNDFVGTIDKFREEASEHFNKLDDKIEGLEIKPPCAMHDEQILALHKLVELHADRLTGLEASENEKLDGMNQKLDNIRDAQKHQRD
jgi:hypothetical protein